MTTGGFYRFDGPDGSYWVHMRGGRLPAACVARDPDKPTERCGRMSVALCDAPAGETLGGKPLTCNAPICERHRTSVGKNLDHCPRHVGNDRKGEP